MVIENLIGGFRSSSEEEEGELITSRGVCPRCGTESRVSEIKETDNGELFLNDSYCEICD